MSTRRPAYSAPVASHRFRAVLILVTLVIGLFSAPRPALAIYCFPGCCFTDVVPAHVETQLIVLREHLHLDLVVFGQSAGAVTPTDRPQATGVINRLQDHEAFLIDWLFELNIQPALMMMTEQLLSLMMQQMLIVGSFLDAKQQLETQLLFQELSARAHKDYQPSFGMCEFGTNVRSLAAAEFNGDFSRMALNKHFIDRQSGVGSSVGASGPDRDRLGDRKDPNATAFARLGYFVRNTCDDNDNNKVVGIRAPITGLALCAAAPQNNGWVNRDIDWNNTVMSPRTINVDYTTSFAESASDNQRLFEMSNYLYGHKVPERVDNTTLLRLNNQKDFLNMRSVIAKRSVAQNSFNAIVGLKSRGTRLTDPGNPRTFSSEQTSEFMRFYLTELGFPPDDPQPYREYLFHKRAANEPPGARDRDRNEISYYAQMEILAKKIYQRPEFYTQLYDKPANVARKSAAMQAIKLMLERDIFDSQLRSEAIMSMILELKVGEDQQDVEKKLGLVKEQFR